MKLKGFAALFFLFILLGAVSAQQMTAAQYGTSPDRSRLIQPSLQGQEMDLQQLQPAQPLQPPPQQPVYRPPPKEKASEFEQFISGKIEITDTQFEILKKYEGITFSNTIPPQLIGRITMPVKVIATQEKADKLKLPVAAGETINAGFLIGTIETIHSAFKMLGIKAPFTVSTEIKQFGYDLFKQPPSTFTPSDKIPVGPDYIIGPGDELKVTIWGKVEGMWSIIVDRDGKITLPKVGVIGIAGLTFREVKDILLKEFSRYYTGFEMNVSMGALRSIRIYAVGNAERPGAYTVSSLSTLINALFESGGPTKSGTMRDIQLKRNGKTIVHFDMYDFLLKGDKTKDVRLMPEDVIFIPPVGPLAGIAGSVNNPGIYELKGETKISQLIEMGGELTPFAFKGRVQMERIIDNIKQVVSDFDLVSIREYDMLVQSGDLIKIYQIIPDKKLVRVSGAVQREGEYGYRDGMTIKDLISLSGGIKYYAFNEECELTRVSVTDKGPLTEKILINLEKALAGNTENNIALKENDYIFIRPVPEWELYRRITIQGEIKFPGIYTIKKGERISSLFERAGGYTDRAYLRGAVFSRERVRELQQKSLDEMVKRLERELLAGGGRTVSTALSSEEIQARAVEYEQRRKYVESLRELKAGGRMTIMLGDMKKFKGSEYDIELEEGDSINIPAKNNVVNVVGSVMSQGSFIYRDKYGYEDYIGMTGGYSNYADKNNIFILKVDGSAKKTAKGWSLFKSDYSLTPFGENIREIEPGDTIVVPEKLERIAWLRDIKDVTTVLYNIAITTGVLKQLFPGIM